MKTINFRKKADPPPQTNAISSVYNTYLGISYGTVDSNNTDGTCNVLLNNGFMASNIRIPSTIAPVEDPVQGGIVYPVVDAKVAIIHPVDDLNAGFIFPGYLNSRNTEVDTELLSGGDKTILPGGWIYTYDQATGKSTFTHGTFVLDVDPNAESFSFTDFKGNTISADSPALEINGDADFAVAFNDLKAGYDQLKTDINTFIGVYNLHTHLDPISGSTGGPSASGAASAASIDASKVASVKLP